MLYLAAVLRVFGFIVVIGGLFMPFVGTRLLTSFSAGENTTVLEQQHHANIGHALSVAWGQRCSIVIRIRLAFG